MVKKDPIKLDEKKNLKKKQMKENNTAVDRPVDRTQWVVGRWSTATQ